MRKVRSADGTMIAVEEIGGGAPVVLVDGGFGSRAFPSAVADLVARQRTAVRYDRRGRNDSGDAPGYAPAREIEDLAAVLDGTGATDVFGMSSGGVLALDAAQAGLPIGRLAVYEPPIVVDDGREPVPDGLVAELRLLVAEGKRGDAVALMFTTAVGLPHDVVEAVRQDASWPALEAVAHTLAYDAELQSGLMRGQALPTDRWDRVTQSVLVVDGEASPEWTHNGMAALTELLGARRVSLRGQKHDVAAEVLVPVLLGHFT